MEIFCYFEINISFAVVFDTLFFYIFLNLGFCRGAPVCAPFYETIQGAHTGAPLRKMIFFVLQEAVSKAKIR